MANPHRTPEEKCVRTSVTIPYELRKRADAYCDEHERALSWVVQKALADWLDKHESAGEG